jgi:hypothetical protein
MIDASVLVNPVNSGGWGQQQLPTPNAQDIKRFEDFLTQGGIGVDASQNVNEPVLSIVEPSNTEFGGFKQVLLDKAQVMDSSYHNALSAWHDIPSVNDTLNIGNAKSDTEQMRSYPEVGNHRNMSVQMQDKADIAANTVIAAADYQNKIYQWATKMEVWSSHMKILSAAVGQLSQGFKTLFQAG